MQKIIFAVHAINNNLVLIGPGVQELMIQLENIENCSDKIRAIIDFFENFEGNNQSPAFESQSSAIKNLRIIGHDFRNIIAYIVANTIFESTQNGFSVMCQIPEALQKNEGDAA